MPYCTKTEKEYVDKGGVPATPGQLNYAITMLCKHYWDYEKDYRGINDVLGALEGAKLEFYRRVAVPYEQRKRKENGDVY
jgi:hypothetical protein